MKIIYLILFFLTSITTIFSQEYKVSTIDTLLSKKVNSVVRKDIMTVTINSVKEFNVKSTYAITVFNKQGNNHINLSMDYSPEKKINKLHLAVYNKKGEEIKRIKENKFEDRSVGGSYLTLAQDNRYKSYNYENSNYPYTIELVTEYTSSNTCFLPKFYFSGRYGQSVETAEFIFNNPAKIPFKHKEYNFSDQDIIAKEKTETKLHYVAKNIKKVKKEKLSPSSNKIFPYVAIALEKFTLVDIQGEANNWKSMGLWQNDNLLKSRRDLPESTIQEVTKLVSSASSNKEKAKLIYEYVQNKTRYISIQLGIGGWKPILASEVDKLGYGDCKALTNYTKALLDSQGIPAYYTVINAGNNIKNYNEDLVCMQGNHVLLNLPGENNEEDTWLECTSQSVPFGYISGSTDNRSALVITPEGGKIKQTKKYSPEESLIKTTVQLTIDSNNKVSGNFERMSKGSTYQWFLKIQNTENKEAYYKQHFSRLNNFTITTPPELEKNTNDIYFKEQFNFNISSYASKAGQKLIIKPILFNRDSYKKIDPKRQFPFVIQRGYSYKDKYTINLIDNLKIHSFPKPKKIESKFGSYSLTMEKITENKIVITRNLLMNDGEFPKGEIEAYNTFIKTIHKNNNSKFIITQ